MKRAPAGLFEELTEEKEKKDKTKCNFYLKLGCITNFDMLFLMMGFISLVDEFQFIMLISSCHICILQGLYYDAV